MSKKIKIGIAAAAAVLLIIAVVVVIQNNKNDAAPNDQTSGSTVSVVGTWYSNKPDSVTFTDDGHYKFDSWNGGNPWLTFAGTYSVEGDVLTLQSEQDGKTVLTINNDGSRITLVGKYTYYNNVEDATASIEKQETEEQEKQENIIPNTVSALIGEWISNDGLTTCVITDSGITVNFKGNDAVPAESLYSEYRIINDKQIEITKSGAAAIYPYTLTEKNGTWTFYCTGIDYAPSFTKLGEGEEPAPVTQETKPQTQESIRVIKSEKNPDKGSYTEELNAAVQDLLIGTWKGTFDEWPSESSIYWIYTFSKDGQYTFTNGDKTESGSYVLSSDPNDNYYSSVLELSADGEERTVRFYLTTGSQAKMITDDQTDPTFVKS